MESGQVKTGDDVDDTFVKMLQEVSRITVPMAYGIAAKYPNVVSLVEGLNAHGPLALENVRVRFRTYSSSKSLTRPCAENNKQKWGSFRQADRSSCQQKAVQHLHGLRPLLY